MQVFRIDLGEHYSFLCADGKKPYADAYLPYNLAEMNRQDEIRPTMIICPGGAYSMCSEREAEPIALKFLEMGFNVFILFYSVAPHRFPSQLIELAALFDFVHKNAAEYHCDTEKIGLIGFSAGGHLAAHYSNLWNSKYIKEHFEAPHKPAFCALCYPVISTENAHRGSFINLLGHFPETKEEVELFSCEKLVSKDTPPTFLFHSVTDTTVPVQNSLCYATALADNSISFEMHIYKCGHHGISTADHLTLDSVSEHAAYTSDWLCRIKKWLSLSLGLK